MVSETIPAVMAGERVDRVVALLTGRTRAEVAALVAAGAVRIAGRPVRSRSRRVSTGELLEIDVRPSEGGQTAVTGDPSVVVPVVYADVDVIVVDKLAGLVVHPGAGQPDGTLVHGLVARFPDLAQLGGDRPGIVHRLDKGTSGLMVVARTAAARERLVEELAARRVDRRYAAMVWGTLEADAGLIDAPLGRGGVDRTSMTVRAGGREARTRYQVEQRFSRPAAASLLECRLETGRTHQIRAHLAAIGHPVAGDVRYGRAADRRRSSAGELPRLASGDLPRLASGRHWLHARRLSFEHPVTGHMLAFESALPEDLAAFLAAFS